MGPYKVLPHRFRVYLRAMPMKGCPVFPKSLESLEPHHQIVLCHIQDTHRGSYPAAEAQSVFYTAPADWASKDTYKLIAT